MSSCLGRHYNIPPLLCPAAAQQSQTQQHQDRRQRSRWWGRWSPIQKSLAGGQMALLLMMWPSLCYQWTLECCCWSGGMISDHPLLMRRASLCRQSDPRHDNWATWGSLVRTFQITSVSCRHSSEELSHFFSSSVSNSFTYLSKCLEELAFSIYKSLPNPIC